MGGAGSQIIVESKNVQSSGAGILRWKKTVWVGAQVSGKSTNAPGTHKRE
jgi:hypothetical protein